MTSKERVMTALDFHPADRVPRFDEFWLEFVQMWGEEKNLGPEAHISEYYDIDIYIAVGREGFFPTQSEVLEDTDEYRLERNDWGEIVRTKKEAGWFYQQLETLVQDKSDFQELTPDPPDLPLRYEELDPRIAELKRKYCVFAKTGGSFIRTQFLRGQEQLLCDMASDPQFAAEMFMFTSKHLTQIGLEELRRWDLYDTGIWIFDDMAAVKAPLFSPKMAEELLAPAWKYMIDAYKEAGARKVILHSDGNILPLLDLFVDIGFDGINPAEPRAGLDVVKLRAQYGERLAMVGGLDNAGILPRGNRNEIREHVRHCLAIAAEGGFVIGTHTIGPDISVATYDYLTELIAEYDDSH